MNYKHARIQTCVRLQSFFRTSKASFLLLFFFFGGGIKIRFSFAIVQSRVLILAFFPSGWVWGGVEEEGAFTPSHVVCLFSFSHFAVRIRTFTSPFHFAVLWKRNWEYKHSEILSESISFYFLSYVIWHVFHHSTQTHTKKSVL